MILFDQIKAELSQLIEDIESDISSCHRRLEKLDSARITLDDQKNFLVDLSDDFQKLCDALFDRRLSAMIVNLRRDFEEKIRTKGTRWEIVQSASRKKDCRTRKQAIEEVRKLLRMSRECEV